MEDNLSAAAARWARRMRTIEQRDKEAARLNRQADRLQQQLDNPPSALDEPGFNADDTTLKIEGLRQRASALTRDADDMLKRLFKRPSEDMVKQAEDWARAQERDGNDWNRER